MIKKNILITDDLKMPKSQHSKDTIKPHQWFCKNVKKYYKALPHWIERPLRIPKYITRTGRLILVWVYGMLILQKMTDFSSRVTIEKKVDSYNL